MKAGDEVFIRALEARGTITGVMGNGYTVTYNAGPRGFIEELFNAEDLEPLTEGCCGTHNHHWNNGGNDPTHCLKCGMSHIRYVFMECE